jgi:uncharacterized protein (TIGR03067 family)
MWIKPSACGREKVEGGRLKHLKKMRWVIQGDKITMGNGEGRDEIGSVKVDSTRQPKEIDILTRTACGPQADHMTPGIYKLHDHRGAGHPSRLRGAAAAGAVVVLTRM